MTVKELIKELRQFDGELEVVMDDNESVDFISDILYAERYGNPRYGEPQKVILITQRH